MRAHRIGLPLLMFFLVLSSLLCDLLEEAPADDYWAAETGTIAAIQTEDARPAVAADEFAVDLLGTGTAIVATAGAEHTATAAVHATGTARAQATGTAQSEAASAVETATAQAQLTQQAALAGFFTQIDLTDRLGDATDCRSGAAFDSNQPVVDIGAASLSAEAGELVVSLSFPGATDLPAEIGDAFYEVGLMFNDPQFPLPAPDPTLSRYLGTFNRSFTLLRFAASQPFTLSAANYQDGRWHNPAVLDVAADVADDTVTFTAALSELPPNGSLSIYSAFKSIECDDLDISDQPGEFLHFTRENDLLVFHIGPPE